jgi:hypothetical protein
MELPGSGSSAASRPRAAGSATRRSGRATGDENVSWRNVRPTPSVPPTARSDTGVHGRPFIISANRLRRTGITLPSRVSPATTSSRKARCSAVVSAGFAGRQP